MVEGDATCEQAPPARRAVPHPLLDIAYANRNETKHLPYGEGTLRAEPLGKALARFARPATVISESPGEESHQGDPQDPEEALIA